MKKADIGLIGLAVMGENLLLNLESKGFVVACYNRTAEKVKSFVNGRGKNKNIIGCLGIKEMINHLKAPRMILMMVKAGSPADDLIHTLLPLLDNGDILIDGGNSHYEDSERRMKYIETAGKLYVGTGISGGEEGALKGPSIMPGGSQEAWRHVKPVFEAVSARTEEGIPCCEWIGKGGAGHFVKMVHNGIEYGDMQIICEAYHLMRDLLGMPADEMSLVFKEWNKSVLKSYLIEITGNILAFRDETGEPLLDKILDTAGQKGTGKWTVISALDNNIPLTLISEAVFSRFLSKMKEDRLSSSKVLPGPVSQFKGNRSEFIKDLRKALYGSKIVSYAQGFALMKAVSDHRGWNLNYGKIASIWRGGCIIRSIFLKEITKAYKKNPELPNLLLDPFFTDIMSKSQKSWRRVASQAITNGIPIPAISSALSYYDSCRTERLPANLLQAQRDYFGAHTYERTDRPRGVFFHTDWTGQGGKTSSSSYSV